MIGPAAHETLPGKNIGAPAGNNGHGANISIFYRKIQSHAKVTFRSTTCELAADQNDL
jgi:hypothetical protein